MDNLSKPSKLQMEENLSQNWKRFKQKFLLYLTAAGYEGKEAKMKTSLLLHVIGEEALDIYNTFTFTNDAEGNPSNMNLDIVMDKFALQRQMSRTNDVNSFLTTKNLVRV
ncbi:hypothetical protein HOLleu_17362 [Holothuria leucospilota]|uniref:Uncharacterized protein n=1 Tax=Holothuria leucospilota TaxID=206669 RepID=A0A9Q1C808_HOLLE|nr:hypothetical protein HOLleu_17362 [Holothuria leucospilota]